MIYDRRYKRLNIIIERMKAESRTEVSKLGLFESGYSQDMVGAKSNEETREIEKKWIFKLYSTALKALTLFNLHNYADDTKDNEGEITLSKRVERYESRLQQLIGITRESQEEFESGGGI